MDATEDGERAAPAAAPDAAGGTGKRRRCGDVAGAGGAGGAAQKRARSRCPHQRERSKCLKSGVQENAARKRRVFCDFQTPTTATGGGLYGVICTRAERVSLFS